MSNIVDFFTRSNEVKADDMIWQCGCGTCSFILYQSGAIECTDCKKIQDPLEPHDTILKRWTHTVLKDPDSI